MSENRRRWNKFKNVHKATGVSEKAATHQADPAYSDQRPPPPDEDDQHDERPAWVSTSPPSPHRVYSMSFSNVPDGNLAPNSLFPSQTWSHPPSNYYPASPPSQNQQSSPHPQQVYAYPPVQQGHPQPGQYNQYDQQALPSSHHTSHPQGYYSIYGHINQGFSPPRPQQNQLMSPMSDHSISLSDTSTDGPQSPSTMVQPPARALTYVDQNDRPPPVLRACPMTPDGNYLCYECERYLEYISGYWKCPNIACPGFQSWIPVT